MGSYRAIALVAMGVEFDAVLGVSDPLGVRLLGELILGSLDVVALSPASALSAGTSFGGCIDSACAFSAAVRLIESLRAISGR